MSKRKTKPIVPAKFAIGDIRTKEALVRIYTFDFKNVFDVANAVFLNQMVI